MVYHNNMARKHELSLRQQPLGASDVKRIRESLGLTQAEAGELLGGGVRAFQKYESGVISPSATAANLLRLLESDPGALTKLTGRRTAPLESADLKPFEVSAAHVAALGERRFVALIRRLLVAEALGSAIPLEALHVASKITVPDGGEDGRLEWTGGPERTSFLPSRLCQIQTKAGPITPAKAAADVRTAAGDLEPAVAAVLASGGTYLMLCNQPYSQLQLKKRRDAINVVITAHGIAISDTQIQFRDADQMAVWVNTHPSVATWVLEQTQPGLANSLHSWSHWAGRHEHDRVTLVADARIPPFATKLRQLVNAPRSVARVLGLSGIGKSRLVLEALGPTPDEELSGAGLSTLVLYAVESEIGSAATKGAIQALVDSGARAIAVIDRCTEDTHEDLAAMIKRASSRVSLVTIDHELPKTPAVPSNYLVVNAADDTVIEAILQRVAPDLPREDLRRLVRFSHGYPQLAVLVGESWLADLPLAAVSNDTLIDKIVLGRRPLLPDKALRAAMLLSVFGSVGFDTPLDAELTAIAQFRPDVTVGELRACIEDLRRRGVVQRRGRLATLQPRPIAAALSERQWREWNRDQWDAVLTGSPPAHLRDRAARHLTFLNTVKVGQDVASHVCRVGGPLDGLEQLSLEGNSQVLSSLAEIDAGAVGSLLLRVIGGAGTETLRNIGGDARRHLVWTLQKIAFRSDTFEHGATLLLRLATAENERIGNNATGQFAALFPVFNGATVADGQARLSFLDEHNNKAESTTDGLIVQALLNGIKMEHVSRIVGSESHGLARALEPWLPKTWGDAWAYVTGCIERLAAAAKRPDSIGQQAAHGLGHYLRALVRGGLVDLVERVVAEVIGTRGTNWPEALSSLSAALQYDASAFEPGVEQRIRTMVGRLTPDDLAGRVRFLVTNMPWDYPSEQELDFDTKEALKGSAVKGLVQDLLKQPDMLAGLLPQLSDGEQRMALSFGWYLGTESPNPPEWRRRVLNAYRAGAPKTRNPALLTGYIAGLALKSPAMVERLKRAALRSTDFAPILPLVCWKMGFSSDDIRLVCVGLRSNAIAPHRLMQWTFGGRLAKLAPESVAPLFDFLLNGTDEAYEVGLELLGMYAFNDSARLEHLRPQLLLLATGLATHALRRRDLAGHAAKELIIWLLRKGRADTDACHAALALARGIVDMARSDDLESDSPIKPMLPELLRDFPEIVWPLIGQAICADRKTAWQFQLLLGDSFGGGSNPAPPLLQLPEGTLFAWCHAYPESAPAFVAGVMPILTTRNAADNPALHPIVRRLIDDFGVRADVQNALVRNLHTFGWMGSRSAYFDLFKKPLSELADHKEPAVRRWAVRVAEQVASEIQAVELEEQEQQANWE